MYRKRLSCAFYFLLIMLNAVFLPPLKTFGADNTRLFIIDDDIGMDKSRAAHGEGPYMMPWVFFTDPDGGMELIYALAEPHIKILGITCQFGCSSTDVCMAAGKKILELTGHEEVPLLRGASSPDDLGRPTDAARFIVDTVKAHPGQVEIIATAPLTNIATALMLEPDLPQYWNALHVATGDFFGALGEKSDGYQARWIGYQDMNVSYDIKAVKYVIEHVRNFSIYPNELMDQAAFTTPDWHKVKKLHTPLSDFVCRQTTPHIQVYSGLNAAQGVDGLFFHGVIPVAIVLDPSLAQPPEEMRIIIGYKKFGGHYFKQTDDYSVPARPVYTKLSDPGIIRERFIERCR